MDQKKNCLNNCTVEQRTSLSILVVQFTPVELQDKAIISIGQLKILLLEWFPPTIQTRSMNPRIETLTFRRVRTFSQTIVCENSQLRSNLNHKSTDLVLITLLEINLSNWSCELSFERLRRRSRSFKSPESLLMCVLVMIYLLNNSLTQLSK